MICISRWWLVLIVLYVVYTGVARYCDVKLALGIETTHCSCR